MAGHRAAILFNLTLKNTYISPLNKIIYPENQYEYKPKDNLNERLNHFFKYGKSLLLIGSPGIGKTSIVCCLADKYKDDPNIIILRFSDWNSDEWDNIIQGPGESILAKAIMEKLSCRERELDGKVFILDGFDEIKYKHDSNDLLKNFLLWIRGKRGTKVIVTSRENYVKIKDVKFQTVIKLCQFNEQKILTYVNFMVNDSKYFKDTIDHIDKSVYGIPVMVYSFPLLEPRIKVSLFYR